MSSFFNYDFDIAAIALMIIVIAVYKTQPFVKNISYYIFVAIMVLSVITPVFDILSVISMDKKIPWLFYGSNTIYYLGQQWTAFAFFAYALAPLTKRMRVSTLQKIVIFIPILIITVLIVINPWTKWVYDYDFIKEVYIYADLQFACYIPALFYYCTAVYYAFSRADSYNKHIRYTLINTIVIIMTSIIAQLIFPYYLLHSMAISLSLVQILAITITLGITYDPRTNMLNRDAFYEHVNGLIYNKVPFNVVAVRMADYETILSTYGLHNIEELESAICHELVEMTEKNCAFKLNDDIWVMLFENQSESDNELVLSKVDLFMDQKWSINNIDISFARLIVNLKYPENFTSIPELVSLMIYLQKTRRMRFGIMPIEEFAVRDLKREKDVELVMLDAIKNRTFEVYYQPIYSAKENRFVSAEALIRLNNSPIGPIYPDEFIPIAEKSDMVIQIGRYVLEEVCKFIASEDFKKSKIDYVEVNLSAVECLQRTFIVNLFTLIREYNINPSSICFEITETASNCAPEIFSDNLSCLHNTGFRLAIDDFGTGYGNLQRLISTSFDIVKFDKNTTQQICNDKKIQPIYNKMVSMIHALNASIVAEGVEEEEQLDFLCDIGTDYIQGYYFAKPLPKDEFVEFTSSYKDSQDQVDIHSEGRN